MVDKLGEVLHCVRQLETVLVVARKMSKPHCKLQQNTVHPLLHLNHILHLSLLRSHAGQHHHCSLLVKTLAELKRLILPQILQSDS